METTSYDLVEVIKLLKKNFKTILLFTALGLIAAIIFVSMRKNIYTSESKIILKSFMYFDRNQMFSENALYVRDVFAKESENDKAISILESGDVIGFINEETNYMKIKGITNPKTGFETIKSHLDVKRTDNSDLEVKFTDTDPDLAYNALKAALYKAEDIYIRFFEDFNRDVTQDIDFKRKNLIDSIAVLNKDIAEVRKTYNLYNVLTPVRGNVIANNTAGISEANAEGVEKLQTLITMKDKLDAENAKLTSLKSQYNSFLNDQKMHVFYRFTGPYKPEIPSNLNPIIVVAASVVAAFIFACFWILIANAFRSKK